MTPTGGGDRAATVDDGHDVPDALPVENSAYWDELTTEALDHLHRIRQRSRGRRRRALAYWVYVVAFVIGFYAVPYAAGALRAATGPVEPWAGYLRAALPAAATAAGVSVLHLAVTDAMWRGPVLVDGPTATWLLPAPLRRSRLLRPRFRRSCVLYAGGTALLAGVVGFVVQVVAFGTVHPNLAAVPVAGAALGGLAAGVAGLAERYDEQLRRRHRALSAGQWSAVALTALALASVLADLPPAVNAVLLWSGPWGWAAQALVHAAGGTASGWVAALLLLAAAAALAVALADSAAGFIPGTTLRTRVQTVSGVSAAVVTLDLRLARQLVDRVTGGARVGVRTLRVPAPRSAQLAVPWRDVLGWLRDPSRLAWSALQLTAAYLTVSVAAASRGWTQATLVGLALVAAYGCAVQLVEAARLDTDDVRRSRVLPLPYPSLMLRHALAPMLVLLLAGGFGCLLVAVLGGAVLPAALVLACLPALVLAAVASACRGLLPVELLVGAETAVGNTAPAQVLFWYLRAPIVATLLLSPVVYLPLLLRSDGVWSGFPTANLLALLSMHLVVVTAGLAMWVRRRAEAHYRR